MHRERAAALPIERPINAFRFKINHRQQRANYRSRQKPRPTNKEVLNRAKGKWSELRGINVPPNLETLEFAYDSVKGGGRWHGGGILLGRKQTSSRNWRPNFRAKVNVQPRGGDAVMSPRENETRVRECERLIKRDLPTFRPFVVIFPTVVATLTRVRPIKLAKGRRIVAPLPSPLVVEDTLDSRRPTLEIEKTRITRVESSSYFLSSPLLCEWVVFNFAIATECCRYAERRRASTSNRIGFERLWRASDSGRTFVPVAWTRDWASWYAVWCTGQVSPSDNWCDRSMIWNDGIRCAPTRERPRRDVSRARSARTGISRGQARSRHLWG